MKTYDLSKEKRKLASRLYKVRNELGLKQIDLQREGIISQSHLSKIENGEINVTAVMLYILSKRYGKEMSFFFE